MKLLAAVFLIATGIASADFLAYTDPTVVGNQNFTGSLGMDFNVNAPIRITGLGAFDSAQNGFTSPIHVQIYDRTSGLVFGGLDLFIADMSGTLMSGDRVVNLGLPVMLPSGFQGSVVASGFSAADPNGNSNPIGGGGNFSALNTGGGLISFVGTSRWSTTPGVFPTNPDAAAAKYGAGTFLFTAAVPEPASLSLVGFGLVAASLCYRRKRVL